MHRAELAVENCIGKFEVGLGLLVALEHEHAAAKIVVNSSSVNCITAEHFFADLLGLEVEAHRLRRLLHVIDS